MEVIKAITLSLGDIEEPIVTSYQLGKILYSLYKNKSYKGESLSRLKKELPDKSDYSSYLNKLLNEGVLSPYGGFYNSNSVFSLLGRVHDSEEDVICAIDPFCYMSHLNAMDYHGLTNRIPSTLFFSSPNAKEWKKYSLKKMRDDIGEYIEEYESTDLPILTRTNIEKVNKRSVYFYNSLHLGAFKKVRNRSLRVATIGRTFLDMLRAPKSCGGMSHVLETFENHGEVYLRLITDEVERHGKAIEKVRAGYILEELMGIKGNDVINSWKKLAQRGGSRKLDPNEEYIPSWSDTWCLSINI